MKIIKAIIQIIAFIAIMLVDVWISLKIAEIFYPQPYEGITDLFLFIFIFSAMVTAEILIINKNLEK